MKKLMPFVVGSLATALLAGTSPLVGTWEYDEKGLCDDAGVCFDAYMRLTFDENGTSQVEIRAAFDGDFWAQALGEEVAALGLPPWKSMTIKAAGTYVDDGAMFQMTFDRHAMLINNEDAVVFLERTARILARILAELQGIPEDEWEALEDQAVAEMLAAFTEEPLLLEGMDEPVFYQIDGSTLTLFEAGEPVTVLQRATDTAVVPATWGAVKGSARD